MEIKVTKEFRANGVSLNVFGADMAVYFSGVEAVHVCSRTSRTLCLHLCRASGVVGSLTVPVVEAAALAVELGSLGVEVYSEINMKEVA